MSYKLLVGGYRPSIAVLAFDPSSRHLEIESDSPAPENPSWITTSKSDIYSISEAEGGSVLKLNLGDGVTVTKDAKTNGAPCHVMVSGDRVVVSNYLGGSLSIHDRELTTSTMVKLPYAYEGTSAPNPERQDASHAHQTIEGPDGLHVADLGSDRVYFVQNVDGEDKVVDWAQCDPAFGPRHVALSPDGSKLYVLGELGHAVTAFPATATRVTPAIIASTISILPDSVPSAYTKYMDAAELVIHPSAPETIYASNRLELHASEMNPSLPPIPADKVSKGDTVAVVLYDENGTAEKVKHVRTGCCCIRGMAISHDGKYAAVAGMCKGGVEVYEISGERKDEWKLVASLPDLLKVTDFVWL